MVSHLEIDYASLLTRTATKQRISFKVFSHRTDCVTVTVTITLMGGTFDFLDVKSGGPNGLLTHLPAA